MINEPNDDPVKSSQACDPSKRGPIQRCLRFISVGKYKTTLYYKGGETYSSSLGGLLTLISGLIIALISFSLLYDCVTRKKWNIKEETIPMDQWEHRRKSFEELQSLGFKVPVFEYVQQINSTN